MVNFLQIRRWARFARNRLWLASARRFSLFSSTPKSSVPSSRRVPAFGLKSLYEPDSPVADIVFVHGLTGHREKTWTHKNATDPWPQCLLPKRIPQARILTFGYDANVLDWKSLVSENRIGNHSRSLLNNLANRRVIDGAADRPLIFVAHSLGGLVCQDVLIASRNSADEHLQNVFKHTLGLMFLGTPHSGAGALALAASGIARWTGIITQTNDKILEVLRRDSEVLARIQSDFHNMLRLSPSISITCCFEELPLPVIGEKNVAITMARFRVSEFYNALVRLITHRARLSQRIPLFYKDIVALESMHMDMTKFESEIDGGFDGVATELQRLTKDILPRSSKPNCNRRREIVQLERVKNYIERKTLSTQLEAKLRTVREDGDLSHSLAIHGLGGCGKTQLALNYLETHKSQYDPILWVDARSEDTVIASFQRAFDELQLSSTRYSQLGTALKDLPTVRAVLSWLQKRSEPDPPWLVVVDNADDFSWGIRDIIPKGKRGSVIITSRQRGSPGLFGNHGEGLRVDKMEPSEAISILLGYLGLSGSATYQGAYNKANDIAKTLGYLPLAIDLAGAYIANQYDTNDGDPEWAMEVYLNDFKRHSEEMLKDESFKELRTYEKTLATVWDTTFEAIEARNETSMDLLTFLSFFNVGALPDELFQLASVGYQETLGGAGHDPYGLPTWLTDIMAVTPEGNWDDFKYRQALEPLVNFSIIQRTSTKQWRGVSIHSLVRWRAQQNKRADPWIVWCLIFTSAASNNTRQEYQQYFKQHFLPHLTEPTWLSQDATAMQGRATFNDYSKARCCIIASISSDEWRWKEAEKVLIQLIENAKRELGEEHLATLMGMASLALTYSLQGRWKEVEELDVLVMEARKKVLGLYHPVTRVAMGNLALTYSLLGRQKESAKIEAELAKTGKKVVEI